MRRLALLALIPALPLALAGCGDGPSPGEYRTLTASVETTVPADSPSGTVASPKADPVPVADDPAEDDPAEDGTPANERNAAEPTPDVTLVNAEVVPRTDEAVEPPTSADRPPVESLVPEPEFRRERGGALRVTFDDLDLKRVIGIDRPTVDTPRDLPPWLRDLAGQRIRVRGFMKPFEFSTGLTGFTFVRDNGVCCFGPNAKLYDKIQVRLREGTNTDFIDNTAFDVEGVFRIEPTEFLDELLYFYHLDDAVIRR